ncbi:ferrous iron transport protein B [Paracrocinitomix mangrovi]|uniref:ferrous iron transport protein B n=1 Tax=Paracrocinitomix mangrovi TaxID=2862509 RepID=UPI001C8EA868|nr:ferrous iron transport protein B [Paracrocinitomix mangrovi]UKN03138.1 ferrous iron transport protein B [Paracrocinitomix mangrovi]
MKDLINKRVALIGNPNLGKTTLFNALCGLRQKTGNYPGVTVDKKTGYAYHKDYKFEIIDLPGVNSLFPSSKDEELVVEYLANTVKEEFPDCLLVMASALNLKRSLYLVDQVRDLNKPIVLAVNMIKNAEKKGIFIDVDELSKSLGIPVVAIDAKSEDGLTTLKEQLSNPCVIEARPQHYLDEETDELLSAFMKNNEVEDKYHAFLKITNAHFSEDENTLQFIEKNDVKTGQWKKKEAILRYKFLADVVNKAVTIDKTKAKDFTSRADRILVHPFWGYVIFATILFSIFQAIFLLAAIPMEWIDESFANLSDFFVRVLPEGYLSDLFSKGVIPGIGGVVIFVPQIAILFFLFALLEESGYMQRIVFLMDRLMQKFGMSGKSVVPMISGMACAVPAIMSARTIENKKERLITILITPLMTCSARIPVYVIIIALIIPDDLFIGIFHAQGLALMAMYFLGIIMTLVVAFVLKFILKSDYKSVLVIDLPEYLFPSVRTVFISVWTNVKSFLWDAGKIILAASVVLFVLATNGGEKFQKAEEYVPMQGVGMTVEEQEQYVASFQLQHSYLGQMGQAIEPAIEPLGYDWKIGIAIISSLAAREVFVGTISTIYAIDSEETMSIRDRLRSQKNKDGSAVFTLATCISLLLFYAFALQCLSTVAVTYKETKSFKWTAIQFLYMGLLAYFSALIAYQLLK